LRQFTLLVAKVQGGIMRSVKVIGSKMKISIVYRDLNEENTLKVEKVSPQYLCFTKEVSSFKFKKIKKIIFSIKHGLNWKSYTLSNFRPLDGQSIHMRQLESIEQNRVLEFDLVGSRTQDFKLDLLSSSR
jgi:hypothetical protein